MMRCLGEDNQLINVTTVSYTHLDVYKGQEFFRKWLTVDPANATTIQSYIDQIEKMPASKPSSEKAAASKPGAKRP